ncbi:hypothetical protein XELAEV_18012413mg [Xenopus laevis]|uniref:Uncharacterized protein n=1 Tax=Xenopus laevis TaxID=8355 RepID=A0A974DML4_XENLA|nr:hypothetical protein XELAEV_18012413mg [Xenopus laevis]
MFLLFLKIRGNLFPPFLTSKYLIRLSLAVAVYCYSMGRMDFNCMFINIQEFYDKQILSAGNPSRFPNSIYNKSALFCDIVLSSI